MSPLNQRRAARLVKSVRPNVNAAIEALRSDDHAKALAKIGHALRALVKIANHIEDETGLSVDALVEDVS